MNRIRISLFIFIVLISSTTYAQSALQVFHSQLGKVNTLAPEDIMITDDYTSNKVRHIYAKRAIGKLELYNSYGAVHIINGKQIRLDNRLHQYLSNRNITNRFKLDADAVVRLLGSKLGKDSIGIEQISKAEGPSQRTVLSAPGIAYNEVVLERKLYLLEKADLRYVWSVEIDEKQSGHWINYFIDVETGEVLHEDDWTVECNALGNTIHKRECSHEVEELLIEEDNSTSLTMMTDSTYNVFAYPLESPNHGPRSLVDKPWLDNAIASPNGWHQINGIDFTVTKGNNVDAYLDNNATNSATNGDADRADGGINLLFDFAWDDTTAPASLPLPALTNLFYWSNVIHDMWYNYGFDEASGNFQEENHNGIGGIGSDAVLAEAQDGLATCNANMSTPPDGGNPRMQMYLCGSRDGDFDNGVIAHEYGHGISNRLTGGPAAAGCLGNEEQMGEGWSDWFGLMMTMEVGDTETDDRPIGTYLFNQAANGPGIRPYPYTTDMSVNPMTYASSFSGVSIPHGVGSVWCTMLWDMTWMMVDEHGFDPDLYNGTGGNNMAMTLVIEALKLQPCSPGFVDGRDAIIAADEAINGGAHVCKLWEIFANRGLGYSASQGTSSSRSDGNEAFDLPPSCTLELLKTTADTEVLPGQTITYVLTSKNNHTIDQTNLIVVDDLPSSTSFVMASNGGTEAAGEVTWPAVDIDVDEVIPYSFQVTLDNNVETVAEDVFDDHESGTANWEVSMSGSTNWVLQSSTIYSGSNAWKAVDGSSSGAATLQFSFDLGLGAASQLVFTHFYDTEEAWDGGLVEISIDNGKTWSDLGDHFTTNGYNNTIFNSKPGFSGNSGGFITSEIDLSAYDGQLAMIRFLMNCDQYVGGNGWYIDDVFIAGLNRYVPNIATSSTDQFNTSGRLTTPTKILKESGTFVVTSSHIDANCFDSADGSATVIASGGSGTYTYAWSSGGMTNVESALVSGTYYCDVSDGILTSRKYFFISQPTALVSAVDVISAVGGANGSAAISSFGGAGPYTYAWSTGASGNSISDLAAGSYMVTVTDADMCSIVKDFDVVDLVEQCEERPFVIEVQLDQSPHEFSYELKNENDEVVYKKVFDDVASGAIYRDVFCLSDGCYSFTITDSFGDGLCASYSSPMGYVTLTDHNSGVELLNVCDFTTDVIDFCVGPLAATLEYSYPSCISVADGSITATPSEGNYTYTYNWSNGATTATANMLLAGTYQVTVSDGVDEVVLSHTLINGNSRVFIEENDGLGSLRAALTNGCPMDTITFDPGLIGDTIYLTSELFVDKSVHVEGMTLYGTYLSGSNQNVVFHVGTNGLLSLESMRILAGNAIANGGAIYNQGQLILKDLVLDSNMENGMPRAISGEGAVFIKGNVKME